MHNISIIGAGIAGLWIGLLAHKQGFNVTIYEQDNEQLSKGCSYRAGGMLAFNCEADSHDDPTTIYGKRSLALWQTYFPELITQNGSLLLAADNDKDQLRYFEKVTTDFKPMGRKSITELEPDLENRFNQGLYFFNEAHLEPRKCQTKLLEYCQALGIAIHFNHYIDHLEGDTIKIDTTGLWAKRHLGQLRGVKGEMMIVKCPDLTFKRPIRLLHPHHPIYIVPYADHHYMIGATTIESSSERDANHISVHSAGVLLTQAYNLHPAFGEAEIIDMNVGYRPAFADNKPAIIHQDGCFFLNGLYRHGWTVAPALAETLINKTFT